MYTVYILESSKGQWYYGSSGKVEQRIQDHNSNRAKYTKFKGPWVCIFKREFSDKSEALRFELQLKRIKNKAYIRRVYSEYFLSE